MTLPLATSPSEATRHAAILLFFLAIGAVLWAWVVVRRRRGKPIIPLARRRPVPWMGGDVLFVFLMSYLLSLMMATLMGAWLGPAAAGHAANHESDLAHPAEKLLGSGNPLAIAIAVTMAVFVVPLIEEVLFRVLLQGWLEAIWSRRRRIHPAFRAAPFAWMPIAMPAALFALMHFRVGRTPLPWQYIAWMSVAQMAGDLLAICLAIAVLHFAARATLADLGWKADKLAADARLGLLALLAVIGPVLAIQNILVALISVERIPIAPDPIPLFFLALVLGTLYHRTHRLAPSLVLHMAFNATSVLLFFLGP